ncbi:hypothetical protein CLV24_102180 [Pontibacter ummariensis]|uniref:Lipoprotein n=1 Tax=Pontibacter ummariensis TaxID=1610492 RepID=A0A239BXF8_9BACT|nr:hypothetical protein [Pontibacter ummariensis]PRY15558.1 hypothetical protein CLV24_102180 [Pontibacter ummariensis]SNS12697.1 hypothetical protein SAMN06296052_102232 [Pontibacter ummariensis]
MRKALLLLVVWAGIAAGCDSKEEEYVPQSMGYDYYPLAVGDYRIYDVTDIKFQHNVGDTTRYQLKERVDMTFYDQTNTLNYKIRRSVRPDANSRWKDDSVLVVSKTDLMVLLTQDNTTYVKLVFPVKEGKAWEGDAYNNRTVGNVKERYSYSSVGESFFVNGVTYDTTVTVVQGQPTDDMNRLDDRQEVYAKGVGLVYRLLNRVAFSPCTPDQCEFGENFKLDGRERHERLVSYGKE